jgi:hypothetical protein
MNYQAFTNDSLTMMYQGVRGALAADDALSELGKESRFRVRETPEWKVHAADLEADATNSAIAHHITEQSVMRRFPPDAVAHAAPMKSVNI